MASSEKKKRELPSWMSICTENCSDKNDKQEDGNKYTGRSSKLQNLKEEKRLAAVTEFNLALNESLPELKFAGNIVYSYHKNDCSILCEDIEMSVCDVDDVIFGFDIEWPVTYKLEKTALIQLCTSLDTCYLFHLSSIGCLPTALQHLLKNSHIKLVGVGIECDLWRLERDYDIQVHSIVKNNMIDLSRYANEILKTSENWSLDGLVKHLLKCKISKDPKIRKSDWAKHPLDATQKMYAATDAYVGLKLHHHLSSLSQVSSPTRSQSSQK